MPFIEIFRCNIRHALHLTLFLPNFPALQFRIFALPVYFPRLLIVGLWEKQKKACSPAPRWGGIHAYVTA